MLKTVTIETDLTEGEIAKLGQELAKAETAKVKALIEKKVAMDGFKGRLDGLESRIGELTASITTGKAPIEMEVEERPGAPGVVEYYRPGTNDKVGERPMSFSDRQQGLQFPDAADRDDDEPPAEEQDIASTPAEAEELRAKRLAAERLAQVTEEYGSSVKTSPLDGGGFLAALDLPGGELLRDTGDTEEAARRHVLEQYAQSAAVTWDDVIRASAEAQEGVDEPAPPVAPRTLSDAPRALLRAPKRKKKGGVVLATPEGDVEVTEETLAAAAEDAEDAGAPAGGDGAPADARPLCAPDCEDDHGDEDHTVERTAF